MKSPSDFFRRASAIAAGACALALCVFPAQGAERHPDPDAQQLFIGENIAVAQTSYGKVRGFVLRDIFCFRGIPYGADTGGENRFMPPRPPEAWEGVRPAVAYGASAPQSYYDRRPESYSMFVDHWNYDLMGEDCLRLNVWTPALDDGKRRPVLVWLHGADRRQPAGARKHPLRRRGARRNNAFVDRIGPCRPRKRETAALSGLRSSCWRV